MTDLDLDAIEARANAATAGPWRVWSGSRVEHKSAVETAWSHDADGGDTELVADCCPTADAAFIAHSRTDIPALVTEIRRLRAEVERLARWKAEALPVLSGLQDLGSALGVPLGQSITGPESVQRARDMVAALDQVRAALANHPRACDTHPEGDPITCGWKRAVADVEAALGVTS